MKGSQNTSLDKTSQKQSNVNIPLNTWPFFRKQLGQTTVFHTLS